MCRWDIPPRWHLYNLQLPATSVLVNPHAPLSCSAPGGLSLVGITFWKPPDSCVCYSEQNWEEFIDVSWSDSRLNCGQMATHEKLRRISCPRVGECCYRTLSLSHNELLTSLAELVVRKVCKC